ncbi:MAG: glycosyltransferase [Parvularculaceae bacterium]|nr:glycosyltransferase [Parvularculaceae bacterium]
MLTGLGIVVIGRNEGERLKACLVSLPSGVPVVYVDSGSTDGSPEWAAEEGAGVVSLDMSKPFSAARGRNAGFEQLSNDYADLEFVHFIDGDCLLVEDWPQKGLAALRANEKLAAVAGQRLERFPEQSWFNELCAIEWNTPVGVANAVGGDAIYRASALREVGGFDPMMMAGEEPELCLRLRKAGYTVERLDADMTLHDAAIHSFGMWWKRATRSGYASTLGALKHGKEGYRLRDVFRALLWGAGLPVLGLLALAVGLWPITAILVLLYGIKWFRLRRSFTSKTPKAGKLATYTMLTNVAEVRGIVRALIETVQGKRQILEYKT